MSLPLDIVRYIYTFDSTCHDNYKSCMDSLLHSMTTNRICDRISGETYVYNIYLQTTRSRNAHKIRLGIPPRKLDSFSEYILSRIRLYGDNVDPDLLSPLRLLRPYNKSVPDPII